MTPTTSSTAMSPPTTQPDLTRSMSSSSAQVFVTSSYSLLDVIKTSRSFRQMTSFVAMRTADGDLSAGNRSRMETSSGGDVQDVERFLAEKNNEFSMLVLPAMIILGLFFVVGVTGNSMVLYVYNRKMQKGTIRWFVQALAIFDLLSCLVAIPAEIIDMRNNYTFGSSPMCKVLRTVSMFCTVASGMTLMVVAVERYKKICTPLTKQITAKGAQVIITVCTVVASICAAPASIIYGPQTIPTDNPFINGTDCSTADVFIGTVIPLAFSSFQFAIFTLGALGLVVLYSLIGRKVWAHAHFRNMGFRAGVSRRMSLFFTGSECSSPTTEDLVFAFPGKKPPPAVIATTAERNSNSSQENNDNDNNNICTKLQNMDESLPDVDKLEKSLESLPDAEKLEKSLESLPEADKLEKVLESLPEAEKLEKALEYPEPLKDIADKTSEDLENPHHAKELEADTPTSPKNKSCDRQVSIEPPCSPTEGSPNGLDTFRRPRSISRTTSRDRVKSGDSSVLRGRYRRRPIQHTQSDMRRFLHRSESVSSGTRHTTLMLFLITLVYLLSFLPYLVMMIVKVLDEDSLSGRGGGWELAHNILLRSYFINSMANPIIYSFCSRTFRKESSKVLHCRCCKCPLFVR